MKRTKKLLALVLAMVMAFTTLVLPAAAHGDEGVMPLYVVRECPNCRGTVREGATVITPSQMVVTDCDLKPYPHTHYVYLEETPYYCTSCPYSGTYSMTYMGPCK